MNSNIHISPLNAVVPLDATPKGVAKRRLWMVMAALLISLGVASASTAQEADALSIDRRWYGFDVLLNRNETNNLMFGSGTAAIAAAFVPDPTASKIVAGVLALYTGYANWVYNRGGCMKFRYVPATRSVIAGHYFGGYCR
jgi:hypothetical protein